MFFLLLLSSAFSDFNLYEHRGSYEPDESQYYFNCDDLTDTNQKDQISLTKEYQYAQCNDLNGQTSKASIKIVSSSVPNYAFYRCKDLKAVTFSPPAGLDFSRIGVGAFALCENLASISFPSTLTTLSDCAFYQCSALSSIGSIPKGISEIGYACFAECRSLNSKLALDTRTGSSPLPLTFQDSSFYETNIGFPSEFPSYVIIGDGVFYGDESSVTDTVEFKGKGIGDYAFYGCQNLKMSIRNSEITSIGSSAFENSGFQTLAIPSDLRTIGNRAFYNSHLSGEVDFRDVTSIGSEAFVLTDIKGAVTLDNYPATINQDAFKGTAITKLTVAKGTINQGAFENCANLTDVTFGDSNYYYSSISTDAFKDAKMTTLTIINAGISSNAFENANIATAATLTSTSITPKSISSEAFLSADIKSLTIDGYTINGDAFSNCMIGKEVSDKLILKNAVIEDSAFEGLRKTSTAILDLQYTGIDHSYSIGDRAFYDTTLTLTNPVFSKVFNTIGYKAFALCSKVTGNLELHAKIIDNYAFDRSDLKGSLTLGSEVQTLQVGEKQSPGIYVGDDCLIFNQCKFTTINIDEYEGNFPNKIFCGMTTLGRSITIKDVVSNIGDEAFLGTSITGLVFERNPTEQLTIGKRAFYKCTQLTNVDLKLERNIQTINEYTFYQCNGIVSVTFDQSTTTINEYAFAKTGIKKLILPKYITTINEGAFKDCLELNGNLDIPNTLTTFGSHAFYNCPFNDGVLTTGLNFPYVPEYAFYNCNFGGDLKLLRITDGSKKAIGDYAFYQCQNLNSIELPEPYDTTIPRTIKIGDGAFQGCTKLKVSPIKYVSEIGKNAFNGCTSLSCSLDFNENLQIIDDYAFNQCTSLTGPITFPTDLQNINRHAFNGCTGLNGDLIFPQSLDRIDEYAFYKCTGLDGSIIFLPSGNNPPLIEDIGRYAFYECSNIKGPLEFPVNLKFIDDYAFSGCSGLNGEVNISTGVRKIGNYAFSGCSGFSGSLDIHCGSKSSNNYEPLIIGRGAFKDCSGFKDGILSIDIQDVDKNYNNHYSFVQFLKIGNEAFEGTKFKNIYYNGRFEPDCDLDIGINGNKGIKTSSHYANKTFCSNPLHKNKLSGGAIAGIVIACIVVVAVIVFLIVFFILKNKKKRDNSEAEVEMNQDP